MKNKSNFLISRGNSMHPLLLNNDIIILNRSKNFKVDDIVVVDKKSHFITHRIVYINKRRSKIITKGDHNFLADKPVKFTEIHAKVNEVIRYDKSVKIENLYIFQSLYYYEEIKKINNHFRKYEIPYVFLKGLPVYLYYTRKAPRRIYADCDILISPDFFAKVENIFQKLGYKKTNYNLNPLLDRLLKNKPEISFSKKIQNFIVTFDIHLEAVFLLVQTNNLSPLYPRSLVQKFSRELLTKKRNVKIESQTFPILSIENQIIYLALHLFHDNFRGYYKYKFLEEVTRLKSFDEKRLTELINVYRLDNFVYPVFKLLISYYSPKVTKEFLGQIKPQRLELINQIVDKTDIFQDNNRISSGINRFKNIYNLSPSNPILKPLVFLRPEVLTLIVFSLFVRLKYYVKR